uniref:Uncharacterized protein n=1 Tax=Anopheles atroparvus TaxID=41427 RepID=A0A182J6N8_ANOAO
MTRAVHTSRVKRTKLQTDLSVRMDELTRRPQALLCSVLLLLLLLCVLLKAEPNERSRRKDDEMHGKTTETATAGSGGRPKRQPVCLSLLLEMMICCEVHSEETPRGAQLTVSDRRNKEMVACQQQKNLKRRTLEYVKTKRGDEQGSRKMAYTKATENRNPPIIIVIIIILHHRDNEAGKD